MCIHSFLSTIDLCLSVNTQPRENKDTVSYLTEQIASEIVMPINMHNQSFSVLHRICRCIYYGIIIMCTLFIRVSSNAEKKKHTSHSDLLSRCIHSPQLTGYNVFKTKSFKWSFNNIGSAISQVTPGVILNDLIFIRKSLSILCIRRNWLHVHTCITYSKQKLSTLRKLQYHGYGDCKFRLFFINFVVCHKYDELSRVYFFNPGFVMETNICRFVLI